MSSEYGNKFEGKISRSIMKYYLIIIYNYMIIFIKSYIFVKFANRDRETCKIYKWVN